MRMHERTSYLVFTINVFQVRACYCQGAAPPLDAHLLWAQTCLHTSCLVKRTAGVSHVRRLGLACAIGKKNRRPAGPRGVPPAAPMLQ